MDYTKEEIQFFEYLNQLQHKLGDAFSPQTASAIMLDAGMIDRSIASATFLGLISPEWLAMVASAKYHNGKNKLINDFQSVFQERVMLNLDHLNEGFKKLESPIEEMFYIMAFVVGIPLEPQVKAGKYRVDFEVIAPERAIRGKEIRLGIELDGHDYHKTKQQRTHDAKRDRQLTKNGWHIIRYTGSEVYTEVWKCVVDLDKLAKRIWGDKDEH